MIFFRRSAAKARIEHFTDFFDVPDLFQSYTYLASVWTMHFALVAYASLYY